MSTPSPEDLKIIEDYLAAHDPAELKSKVADYASKSRKPGTREQIRKEIYSVLKAPGGNHFVIPQSGHPIPAGTPLFRARIIDALTRLANPFSTPPLACPERQRLKSVRSRAL